VEEKPNIGYYIVYQNKYEDFIDLKCTKKENEYLDVADNKNQIAWEYYNKQNYERNIK